jgi:hypothetical protein
MRDRERKGMYCHVGVPTSGNELIKLIIEITNFF